MASSSALEVTLFKGTLSKTRLSIITVNAVGVTAQTRVMQDGNPVLVILNIGAWERAQLLATKGRSPSAKRLTTGTVGFISILHRSSHPYEKAEQRDTGTNHPENDYQRR